MEISTILGGAKKVVPKLIGSKNGISVYREFLKDGTTITKSYKGGQLYKTITQSQVGCWFNKYKQFITDVFNHTTGETFQVSRSIANGKKIWRASNFRLPTQQRVIEYNSKNKIIEDNIKTTYADGGFISITRRPSGKTSCKLGNEIYARSIR
jgi:hypothetical protein